MVGEENKFLMGQVMAPMLDGLDDGVELYIIRAVTTASTHQFFTIVCHRTTMLT